MVQTLPRLTIQHPDGKITHEWGHNKNSECQPRRKHSKHSKASSQKPEPSSIVTVPPLPDRWIARRGYGTHYVCLVNLEGRIDANGGLQDVPLKELESLQDRLNGLGKRRRILHSYSIRGAHDALLSYLTTPVSDLYRNRKKAHDRLRKAYAIPIADATPDLFIKAVKDLDEVLFGGLLYCRLLVTWEDTTNYRGQTAYPRDHVPNFIDRIARSSYRYAHVKLAKFTFALSKKPDLWGALIHEMLHAFIFVATDGGVEDPPGGYSPIGGREWDIYHGPLFARSCVALAERLDFTGLEGKHVQARMDWMRV